MGMLLVGAGITFVAMVVGYALGTANNDKEN